MFIEVSLNIDHKKNIIHKYTHRKKNNCTQKDRSKSNDIWQEGNSTPHSIPYLAMRLAESVQANSRDHGNVRTSIVLLKESMDKWQDHLNVPLDCQSVCDEDQR